MPLKVLFGHNTYQWPGGEDVAMELDAALLDAHGHAVVRYLRDNDEIAGLSLRGKARFAAQTIWAPDARRELRDLLERERPDVAHFHNVFPLISPSGFAACRDAGVPVVLTVANYRIACANAYLFREERVCEACLHRTVKWPAVVHRCYHDSALESGVVASMLAIHRWLHLWSRLVDVFIAVSDFGREKLVEAGLPAEKVVVRENFAFPDPGDRQSDRPDGGFALFVGRLSPEKGLRTLVRACGAVPDIPVHVVGDGPMRAELEEAARAAGANVTFRGQLPREHVLQLMRTARALVFPSLWYEHFPLVIVEAFASGLPVIASGLGAMKGIVGDPGLGATFPPGDDAALAACLRDAWNDAGKMADRGRAARRQFEEKYTADVAYDRLVAIYDRARDERASRTARA
jgi:glycosyltransferase involved in cell wall biosynthesis